MKTVQESAMSTQQRARTILRINFVLALLEGAWVLQQYVSQPSESDAAFLLGFSLFRWILLAFIFLMMGGILLLLAGSFKETWSSSRVGNFFQRTLATKATFWVLLSWIVLMWLALFTSERYLGLFDSYRDRLVPLLWWFTFLAVQAMLSLLYVKSIGLKLIHEYRDVFIPGFVALILFGLFVGVTAFTGLGLNPDPIYWQNAGVPILLIQVSAAWACGLIFNRFIIRSKTPQPVRLDLFVCVGLWALASLLWLSQPSRPSYNSLAPNPPNFQSYPFGDSIIYDIAAHEYAIGKPIPSEFGVKPLYSLFVAVLHLFSGENYARLVTLQVIILAAIPALVYLLTGQLGGRPAGLVASILIILRERNGIALSNVIEVSHPKLILSDVFAMGLMVLALWLFFRWMEKPVERRGELLTLGGVFSLLILTRGHPILLVPLMVFVFLLFVRRPMRFRLQSILLFTVAVAVPLIPWFWRNYEITGKFAFQDPVSRYTTHTAGLFSLTPGVVPPRLEGETDAEYYDRLSGQMFKFMLEHPGEVMKFVSAHQVHNMILGYVYLPHSFRIESLRAYVKTEPFWSDWKGGLQPQEWSLLVLNVGLISLGVGGSWKRKKLLVLVPILVGIGYTLSVSIGRLSGWRFIQPADWITLVYYSIGLMQFAAILRFILTPESRVVENEAMPEPQANQMKRSSVARLAIIPSAFFLIALALTHGHNLFSSRYPAKSESQILDEYERLIASISEAPLRTDVDRFLQLDDAVLLYGRAIYPAYFEADAGAFNHYLLSYQAQPYPRAVFYLLGPQSADVVLPLRSVPSHFPDGAGVIVAGCKSGTQIVEALFVLLMDDQSVLYRRQPSADLACPLPENE